MNGSTETIRIETADRWDALDLVRRLNGYSTHLVQLSDRRWHVCVQQDRDLDALVRDLVDTAGAWAADRHAESFLHVGDRSFPLHASGVDDLRGRPLSP